MLIKRNSKPLKGFWCLPGGIVEYHELVEESAVREVKEETNYKIELAELIGVYQINNDPRGVGQDVIYSGRIKSGTEKTSGEGSEIEYFPKDYLADKAK